ncbi:hypothetical protein KY284_003992 [Solanum tuberosum]|nr:hypothetical protein KY284_003992 [Solanum tuberosum]
MEHQHNPPEFQHVIGLEGLSRALLGGPSFYEGTPQVGVALGAAGAPQSRVGLNGPNRVHRPFLTMC